MSVAIAQSEQKAARAFSARQAMAAATDATRRRAEERGWDA